MWKTEIATIETIKCDECGHDMEPMWQEKEDRRNLRSTIYHCNYCGADRELIREYDNNGNETLAYIRPFFFG